MARPKCMRRVCCAPETTFFKPRGIPMVDLEEVTLLFDEYEALRLADLEGLYQEQAAEAMHISRQTFGRILESAHQKVSDALVNGKAMRIEGGKVTMADKRTFTCSGCGHSWQEPFGTGRPKACPQCGGDDFCRTDTERGGGQGGRKAQCRKRQGGTTSAGKGER
jgi:uncharacterized protein